MTSELFIFGAELENGSPLLRSWSSNSMFVSKRESHGFKKKNNILTIQCNKWSVLSEAVYFCFWTYKSSIKDLGLVENKLELHQKPPEY